MARRTATTDRDLRQRFARRTFEQHRAMLHRLFMRRLHDREQAQDLAQEVYLRLLRVEDAEMVRNPLAFLYRIALNVLYEWRLRQNRNPVLFDSDIADEYAEHPLEGAATSGTDMSETMYVEYQLQRLLAPLPPMMRAVFILRKRDGLSTADIARQTGLSRHTVKKYLYQAVAHCRASRYNQVGVRP